MIKNADKEKIFFILFLCCFLPFIFSVFLGITEVRISYYDNASNLYNNDEISVFVFIGIAIMAPLFIFALINYFYHKFKHIRVYRILSSVGLLLSLSSTTTITIMLIDCSRKLTVAGIIVCIFLIISSLFSIACIIVNIFFLYSLGKYISPKKLEVIKRKQSDNAVLRLRTLKKLLEEGAITEKEYNEKREKYLEYL